MASSVLRALMGGIAGGANAYISNSRYKQEKADEDEQRAFERRFRENQFKEQLVQDKANRDYQATQLSLQMKAGARQGAAMDAEAAYRQQALEQDKHDKGIAAILDRAKLSGYVPGNPEAEYAAQQYGGTVRPIEEDLSVARGQAAKTRRNVDLPGGQGTVVYGYNPESSADVSLYNAEKTRLATALRDHAVRKEQAKRAVLSQYKSNDPLIPRTPAEQAVIDRLANDAAERAGNEFADNLYRVEGIDIDGRHGAGQPRPQQTGSTRKKLLDPRYQQEMDSGDSPPSDGSASPSPSSVSGINLDAIFKKRQ